MTYPVAKTGPKHVVVDGSNVATEGRTAPSCPCRRRNEFVVVNGAVELGYFALIDAMTKRGIDHHRDFGVWKLVHKRQHGFV